MLIDSFDAIDLRPFGAAVCLTIGVFDGVHRGHQSLIEGCIASARRRPGGLAAVFTFQNHPRTVVSPERAPKTLTPWPEKRRLIEALGVDVVIGIPFDETLSRIAAEDFLDSVLLDRCAVVELRSGANFCFGRGGRGTAAMLRERAAQGAFRFVEEPPVADSAGQPISSSRVRDALASGDVTAAGEMLGRPHQLIAPVVAGDQLGRRIGFPTANLAPAADLVLPADGVYAVRVNLPSGPESVPGMLNIGWRPTVAGRDHRVEVHLIGFDGELVGLDLGVEFVARLRDERSFPSLDALTTQLAADRSHALSALATGAALRPAAV